MRKDNEIRYIVTDVVSIPIMRLVRKSDAYQHATKTGWGIVDVDKNGDLYCDDDSTAVLINGYGEERGIYPYEKLDRRGWFKQSECDVILLSDSCGCCFWEKEKGLVKIYITKDDDDIINGYRLAFWTEKTYDDEIEVNFEDLSKIDPFLKTRG